jgi:hypothetical protein
MLLAFLIAAAPCGQGMGALDRFTDCTLFRSPQEAANFSAHAGWSLAIPLAGHAIDGRRGALVAGSAWIAFSLVNELTIHGPESSRERNQNLLSRLVPCAVVMLVELLRRG